jgi:hypothetical protein
LIFAAGVVSGNEGAVSAGRAGIEGRVFGGGAIDTAGVAEIAALGEGAAGAGVVADDAEVAGAEETDGLGFTLGVWTGRVGGDAETAGVALAADLAGVGLVTATVGEGVLAGAAVGVGLGFAIDGVGLAAAGVGLLFALDGVGLVAAGVALAFVVTGVGLAAVGDALAVAFAGVGLAAAGVGLTAVAAGVVEAVVVSTGFTNFFEGAFGGGVASARIFVRARSVAVRSVAVVQPLSMFTSTTRSLTRRGRTISRTTVSSGTDTWSSSPWTLACVSIFRSRRKR